MSVVGIDVGNDTCVVAAVRQRGVDVLLNDESARETPAVVSFADKHRLIGSAAAASAAMNPRSTLSHLKLLLSRHPRDPALRRLPFPISSAADSAPLLLLPVRFLGRDYAFSPTHLLAMLFAHLRRLAEDALAVPVSDCVLGVPSYFSDLHRRSVLHAAAIAGLRPLRLLHDVTATALSYGIYKTDLPTTSHPAHVIFVDIGHCDTQVAAVAFDPAGMRVLAHAADPALGGRDFDEVLVSHFAGMFKEQYAIDVASNARASVRLRLACEKLKKVLSANAEAPLNIECLMDEKDVKGFIMREEFERLSLGLLERVVEPCKKALADAGLSINKVHSVELVGSGSRIPAIVRVLSAFFKREPGRTLNASECVARGCALQCAMLSPVFRVRDYEVQDSFPFSIGFSTDEGPISTLSSNILFRKGEPIPSVKMLTFHRSSTFHLEAFYANPSELPPGVSPKISSFTVGPFQSSQSEKPKVKVKICLNLHGIITVESAWLIENDTDDSISMDASQSNMDNVESGKASKVLPDTVANGTQNGMFEQSEPGSLPTVDGVRKARSSRRLEIPVTETIYGGMTKAELLEAQEQENQLAYQDRLVEQTKDRKNALEAFVYEIRNKLFERYRSFATESEREGISKSLQQTEEWLYEEGDDETENVYSAKLEEIKKLVDPIENRFKDEEARAEATRELLKCVVDHRMAVKSLVTCERDAVISECNKAEQWLREKTQQQDSLPKNADPVLWSHDIKKRTESLDISCKNILRHKSSPSRSDDTRDTDHSNTTDSMQTD